MDRLLLGCALAVAERRCEKARVAYARCSCPGSCLHFGLYEAASHEFVALRLYANELAEQQIPAGW